MPVSMSGRFNEGPNKGKSWQVYADPAQQRGYTRKIWDQYDTSNGGKPTEYFEPFDYGAAEVDAQGVDQSRQTAAATAAAVAAQRQAQQAADDTKAAAFWKGTQEYNERGYQEGVRQFDKGQRLNEVTQRDKLRLGLQELKLRESEGQNGDARAKEKNVMDYLGAIGRLRLPYSELRALSQRAVAGIIPGQQQAANAQAGAQTAQAGALTADQWQALSQGVSRDYEVGLVGQGRAGAA